MNTKSFFLLLLFTLLPLGNLFAEKKDVIVGTGTNTTYNPPFCNYYKHSSTQIIYPSTELKGSGKIYSIAFQVGAAKEFATTNVQIYMGHKSTATFADKTEVVPFESLTLVYSGSPTLGANTGWEEFVLSQPFEYDGTNLVVAISKSANGYESNLKYQYTTKNNTVLFRQNDSDSKYGQMNEAIEYSLTSSRPNIRININLPLVTKDGLVYSCSKGKATVVDVTDDLPNEVTIPNVVTLNGENYNVTSISGKLFEGNTSITSVALPNSITTIPENAFKGCTALTSVIIPTSLSKIPKYAFYGCSSLTSITIPSSVTNIEQYAFTNCTGVSSLTIEDSDSPLVLDYPNRGVFYYCSNLKTVYLGRNITNNYLDAENYPTGTPFGSCAISNLTIGGKVTEISSYAFYNSSNITQLVIPKSITSIGENAFYGCTKLNEIQNFSSLDLEIGTTDNGYVAFYCSKLFNLDAFGQEGDFLYYTKSGVNYIYDYIGEDTEITLPLGYEFAEGALRDKSEIESVIVPSGITKLAPHIFHGCKKLSNVTLPEGLVEIGDFAFCYCSALTEITLPNSLKRIGAGAFSRCQYLTGIDIPEGVADIDIMAFKRCDRMKTVTIPSTITTIKPYTFMGCYNLNTVNIPEGVSTIGNFAFYASLYMRNVTFPSTLESIGRYAFSYTDLNNLELPAGVSYIGDGAFRNCGSFKTVNIPAGVTEIDDYTFAGTSLRDVTLPESVTRIGRMAFRGCPIQYINWPSHLTTIGYEAFAYSKGMKTPTIPSTVTNVGDMMFYKSECNSGGLPGIYCYVDAVVPTTTFHGTDMSNTVLYVRPELLATYKASAHSLLFADIRSVGDYDGDGKISVSDLVSIIETNKSLGDTDKRHLPLEGRDLDGDGNITAKDIEMATKYILNPQIMAQVPDAVTVMPSTPIEDLYVPEPNSDCTLMMFDNGICTTESSAALEMINHIRWEACYEGVKDPSNSSRRLTPNDYHEAQWSTDLEIIARQRAAQTVVSGYHVDMGSVDHDQWNGITSYGECIGYYNFLFSVYAYYDEKDAWVNSTGRTTGHYTALIGKSSHYYGLAYMDGYVSLLKYCSKLPEGADQQMLDDELVGPKVIDVYTKYIKDHVIEVDVDDIYNYYEPTLELGTTNRLSLRAYLQFTTQVSSNCNRYMKYYNRNVTFVSNKPEIATITSDGFVTALKTGNAEIEAQLDGVTVATASIPVTCTHAYDFSEVDAENKATGVCSRCGDNIEGTVPTYFYLMWTNYTLNPMTHSGGVPSVNPVGSKIECYLYMCDGDEAFRDVCVEYLTPNLIDGPSEFHLNKNNNVYFNVKGAGQAKILMYLKSNPSFKRTYTIMCTEAEGGSDARRRMAKPSITELSIPSFPLPELPLCENDEK